jgi:hypothetical protein
MGRLLPLLLRNGVLPSRVGAFVPADFMAEALAALAFSATISLRLTDLEL